MPELSVLIPARNEKWLGLTVKDVLAHSSESTEIIVVLDGAWPEEPLPQHPRVQIVYLPESIGQRAATNLAARISQAEYVAKVDAHVSVAPGWDAELIKAAGELGPRAVQIPAQKNLHIYDRVCRTCGKRNYQGPETAPCACGGPCDIDIVWKPRKGVHTTSWRLDHELHFQYDKQGQKTQTGDLCDVMTSLGACFFMPRAFFMEIGGLDEAHGSWGQFGAEIALKAQLSGGRHVVNKRTWFAHFFRVGGIGFPYAIKGSDQEYARQYSRNLWMGNHWPGQVKPLSWLIDKFAPLPEWHDAKGAGALATVKAAGERFNGAAHADGRTTDRDVEVVSTRENGADQRVEHRPSDRRGHQRGAVDEGSREAADTSRIIHRDRVTRGIVYYTDNRVDPRIGEAVCARLDATKLPIVSVSLGDCDYWSNRSQGYPIALNMPRGYLTMFRQILVGLEALDTDVAFLCEHDVLYSGFHLNFTPPRGDRYYYNVHTWKLDAATGRAVHYRTKQTSGLCADRQLLIEHYRKRIARVEAEGFSRRIGFEPGSHSRSERIDDVPAEEWWSDEPNVDIRHTTNLTPSRWSQSEFRSQRNCQGWTEADEIPGWGVTKGRFWEWLAETQGVLA
jgi:glycosyltransferase involved in cell wall biosynthesis